MNQMEIFKNPEFGSIRVIEENGKYLFCGTDVAAALGYSNSRDAISRHCRYVVKRDAPERGRQSAVPFTAPAPGRGACPVPAGPVGRRPCGAVPQLLAPPA